MISRRSTTFNAAGGKYLEFVIFSVFAGIQKVKVKSADAVIADWIMNLARVRRSSFIPDVLSQTTTPTCVDFA